MPMMLIYAVLIYWLNLFQYMMDCQMLVCSDGSKFAHNIVSDLIVYFAFVIIFLTLFAL